MNKNLKILLVSVIVGIVHTFYVQQPCEADGFGCLSIALGHLFYGVILIPIIFGIIGFTSAKEKSLNRLLFGLGFLS